MKEHALNQQTRKLNSPTHLLAHLAMILFALLIAGSFTLGDITVNHISPFALNIIRFFIACFLMGAVASIHHKQWPPFPSNPGQILILGGLMATYFTLMFVALSISDPVSTGSVFTLIPFMSAAFGWIFLGQRVRPIIWLSLFIAACGAIWVIFRGDGNRLMNLEIGRGELIFLIGCASHAAYAPLVKKFGPGLSLTQYSFWTLTATLVCLCAVGLPSMFETHWMTLPIIVWLTIGYLSVFTTTITFFLLQYASLKLPPAKVLAYGYLTPGFIIILEGLAGHGWVSLSVAAGALVTIVGLIILALSVD